MGYWKDIIVKEKRKAVKVVEEVVDDEVVFEDDGLDAFDGLDNLDDGLDGLGGFLDVDATEDKIVDQFGLEEDLDDFVVDDDGGGYLEDLRTEAGYKAREERTGREAMRNMDLNGDRLLGPDIQEIHREMYDTQIPSGKPMQPSFQSGSSPVKDKRHYLTFNLIGTICAIKSGERNYQMDVSFHDSTLRPFHFSCLENHNLAALGNTGALFACEATSDAPAKVVYRPIDNWASKNEWELDLADGEDAVSVAVTLYGVAIATTKHLVRLVNSSGIQSSIRSIRGPIVTLAGSDSFLMIVYHDGPVYGGVQALAYILLDAQSGSTLRTGHCPLTPDSTLQWVGFSDLGVCDRRLIVVPFDL